MSLAPIVCLCIVAYLLAGFVVLGIAGEQSGFPDSDEMVMLFVCALVVVAWPVGLCLQLGAQIGKKRTPKS